MDDVPATDDDPKTWVTLTDEAHRAIRAAARGDMRETGVRQDDGTWSVPLSADVVQTLEARRQDGESYSDVIMRTIAAKRGLN